MENPSSSKWWNGQGRDALTLALPLNAWIVGRTGPEITRVGEVVLHPTYSSPCTKSWKHNRADSWWGFRPRGHENKRCYHHFTSVIWWHGRRKKNAFPLFTPCYRQQLWELAQGPEEWESWPCPSLAAAHRKTGTVPEQHTSATLLTGAQVSWACGCESRRATPVSSLKCHEIARIRKTCCPSHIPCHLW